MATGEETGGGGLPRGAGRGAGALGTRGAGAGSRMSGGAGAGVHPGLRTAGERPNVSKLNIEPSKVGVLKLVGKRWQALCIIGEGLSHGDSFHFAAFSV